MRKYRVTIEKTYEETWVIHADDEDDAVEEYLKYMQRKDAKVFRHGRAYPVDGYRDGGIITQIKRMP